MTIFFFSSVGSFRNPLSLWPHGSHVLHGINFSVKFNTNLDGRGYHGEILSNLGVNCYN
jgi:hypothetical protein